MATQMKISFIWATILLIIATSSAELNNGIENQEVENSKQILERLLVNLNSNERLDDSTKELERSLIGSLLGSISVNSALDRGILPTLFPTLFPTQNTGSSVNQGLLDTVFSNNLKLQILQAETDYLTLNTENALLTANTAVLTAWKDTCKAPLGTLSLRNLTTGAYYFETNSAFTKNWYAALNFCRQKGLDLLSIEDAEEEKVITDVIKAILLAEGATVDATSNQFWMGLNNNDFEPNFVWDGSLAGEVISFTDWHTNSATPGGANHCGLLAQRNGGIVRWINSPCFTTTARYICEVPEPCRSILRA